MGRQLNFLITRNTNNLIVEALLNILEEPVLWKWGASDRELLQPFCIRDNNIENLQENKDYVSFNFGILLLVSEVKYSNQIVYEYNDLRKEYIIKPYSSPVIEYRFYISPDFECTLGRIAAFYNPKEYPEFEKKFSKMRKKIKEIITKAGNPNTLRKR